MWPFYLAIALTGTILQFLFISWKPSMYKNEHQAHTSVYTEGLNNEKQDLDQPLARIDNFLFMLGIMLLIETYELPQTVLRSRVLVAIGRRSFSTFLVQSTIIYSIGINFWLYVDSKGNSEVVSNLATFFVCAPIVAIASEIFYRLVDLPSIRAAEGFWNFMIC